MGHHRRRDQPVAVLYQCVSDTYSTDPSQQSEMAVLGKINTATLLQIRSQQDANQILAAEVAQQTLAAKQRMDEQNRLINQSIYFNQNFPSVMQKMTVFGSIQSDCKRNGGLPMAAAFWYWGGTGDATHDVLALLLTAHGMQTSNEGAAMRIFSTDQQQLVTLLQQIGKEPPPTIFDLKIKPEHAIREKWDWSLPNVLRLRSFASSQLDLLGARRLAMMLSQVSDASVQ